MSGERNDEFAELDDLLDRAEAVLGTDYQAAMALLAGYRSKARPPEHVHDPFSAEYADWVIQTYLKTAQVDEYDPQQHEADRNIAPDIPFDRYFPYVTQDSSFIGKYIAGTGLIVAELGAASGARIVEYGVGWGHVAAALARAGHQVTCVDIEPGFLTLARRQAAAMGCEIETYHGRFGDRPFPVDEPDADAVIFFEAFHHALDHLRVLRQLRHTVLRAGGSLILAAEPIDPHFPVPWGVRADGHALWAIRRFKWMELGFREDYLLAALHREGFTVTKNKVDFLGSFGLLYHARLHQGCVHLGETLLPSDEAASWAPVSGDGEKRRWAQHESRATLDHDERWQRVRLTLMNYLPIALRARLDTGETSRARDLVIQPGMSEDVDLPLRDRGRQLRIWSDAAIPAEIGAGPDTRLLGVAVEQLCYHAS